MGGSQRVDDRFHRLGVRARLAGDLQLRLGIDGVADPGELGEHGAGIATLEQRPCVALLYARHQRRHVSVKPDGGGGFEQQGAGIGLDEGAATRGDDLWTPLRQPGDDPAFAVAKMRFAETLEDLGDGHATGDLDLGIGIDEIEAEARRQPAADGGFADAHQTDERNRATRCQPQALSFAGRALRLAVARRCNFAVALHDRHGYTLGPMRSKWWRVQRWGAGRAALLLTTMLASTLLVLGQQVAGQEAPKSLLPDEMAEPVREPPPAAPLLPATPDTAAPGAGPDAAALLPEAGPEGEAPLLPDQPPDAFATAATRDTSTWGPLTPARGGYGADVFAGANGRFLLELTLRIDRPIASRWAAIVLRRALASDAAAPAGVLPGDWIAARAQLLLRLGDLESAKLLIDGLPVDRYTPALYKVAGNVQLAGADIAGLCPIASTGRLLSKDALWPIAVGMCAAMAGDDITAAGVFDTLRADRNVDPFDVRLGERVATLAGAAGRAANIDWNEAPAITRFRYGIASAAGVAVPADRLGSLGPARFGWLIRNPNLAPEARLAALRPAAVIGALSASGLVSAVTALTPGDAADDSRAGQLRRAFAGSLDDRQAALRAIWASEPGDGYGARLESAPAAARLPIASASAELAPDVVAALLAAGDTGTAGRWWRVAAAADDATRARVWALLATGAGGVPVTPQAFRDWRADADASDRQAALLLAGLAGLGLANGPDWDSLSRDLAPPLTNSWTRAIDLAAAGGRVGEVAVLAATGLQGDWREVPPAHVYHIVAALNRVGRTAEARLVAAEALMRG